MSFVYAMNSHLGLPLKNTLTGRLFNDGVLARATASGQSRPGNRQGATPYSYNDYLSLTFYWL